MYQKFARVFLVENGDEQEAEIESKDAETEKNEEIASYSGSYIVFTRTSAAVRLALKKTQLVINSDLFTTDSNCLSPFGSQLIPTASEDSAQNRQALMEEDF